VKLISGVRQDDTVGNMAVTLDPNRQSNKPWIRQGEPPPHGTDLLLRALSVSVGAHRCGEVWGTDCQQIVHPPHFEHPGHPAPPPTLQLRDQWGTRAKIAQNVDCPPQLLRRLAADYHPRVRLRVAQNPRCPTDVLDQLAHDSGQLIQQAVATNPNSSAEALAVLYNKWNKRRTLAGATYRIVRDIMKHHNFRKTATAR